MPIEFRCTQCQTLLRTPDDAAGRRAVCPQCGCQMDVPYISAPTPRGPQVVVEDDRPRPSATAAEQMAIASLVLGIMSLCFSCCCLIGLPTSIVGIVLGVKGLETRHRGIAIAGIILCSIGLLASLGMGVANVLINNGGPNVHHSFP